MARSPQPRRRPALGRDERGQSLSLLVAIASLGLIVMVGLVVDGGQQVAAARQCQTAAAAAARAGAEAGAADRVAGRSAPPGKALSAAQRALAVTGTDGSASITPGGQQIRVQTRASRPTYFLSLIGIGQVSATGQAEADLVEVG